MKRCVNEITQLRDDIDQHRKVCKYSWLKFKSNYSSLVHHDRVRSRSDCRRTDPPHNTTRTPWPTLSFFFFSSILDRHTEKLSNFRSSTQEARVWSRAIPIYFALGTKWRVSAVSPTIPWPSTGHATYIYIYIYTLPADTILVSCSGNLQQLTGDVVAKYPRRDDSAVRAE